MPGRKLERLTVPDEDERMTQARRRAQWELGDPSWAGRIVAAFLDPERDRVALAQEMDD